MARIAHIPELGTELFPRDTAAPDFRLPVVDEDRSGRLSDFRGRKPVVLIFGSFGCSALREQADHLRRWHEKYGDRAQFIFVYIREGFHVGPEEMRESGQAALDAKPNPRLRTLQRIRAGRKQFVLDFPCLLDDERGEVQELYHAFPKRLLIVNSASRIVIDSGNGPADPFP